MAIKAKPELSNDNVLNDILAHTAKSKLDQFIREYAHDNICLTINNKYYGKNV